MLEAYLNQRKPLIVSLNGSTIEFKNMNSMTSLELSNIIETPRIDTRLKKLVLSDPDESVQNLTTYQAQQVFQQWEKHSGVTLEEVARVFAVVVTYPKALQSDLLASSAIKTITELLDLPAIDMVAVTNSLLLTDHRSHVVAEIKNWAQPMTVANTVEQMVLTIFNMLRGFLYKDVKPLPLDSFAIKTADNQLDNLAPIDESSGFTKQENDELIERWRKTGKLEN